MIEIDEFLYQAVVGFATLTHYEIVNEKI